MLKIYLKYDQNFGYQIFENAQANNYALQNIYFFLSRWSQDMLVLDKLAHANNWEWVEIEKDDQSKTVLFWSRFDIKDSFNFLKLLPIKEALFHMDTYGSYIDQRWQEIKKIKISFENYNSLLHSWKLIKQKKPLYILFTLDDSGPLDKVELVGKNELSPQELQEMRADHEQYLLWQKAELLYNGDHEIVDDIWRSPADSVFDVDIAKYVGRSQGFVERKVYTKADVIAELQKKLKQLEPTYLIVHWLRVRYCYGVTESDPMFDELLRSFSLMDSYPEDMISREKLQDIADRLSLGQDVALPD